MEENRRLGDNANQEKKKNFILKQWQTKFKNTNAKVREKFHNDFIRKKL